jgi:hypothetical protein
LLLNWCTYWLGDLFLRRLIRLRLRWLRHWLLSHLSEIIVDCIEHFIVEHINNSVERFSLSDVQLLTIIRNHGVEKLLVMTLHAIALEIVVFQLALELDDASAEAGEVVNALFQAWIWFPVVIITHLDFS